MTLRLLHCTIPYPLKRYSAMLPCLKVYMRAHCAPYSSTHLHFLQHEPTSDISMPLLEGMSGLPPSITFARTQLHIWVKRGTVRVIIKLQIVLKNKTKFVSAQGSNPDHHHASLDSHVKSKYKRLPLTHYFPSFLNADHHRIWQKSLVHQNLALMVMLQYSLALLDGYYSRKKGDIKTNPTIQVFCGVLEIMPIKFCL